MEAGMGMRCWILLVYVIVVPVEGTVSFWDHQTPGWNYLWGSNGGHLGTHAARGGKGAMRNRSIPATPGRFPTFYGAYESQ